MFDFIDHELRIRSKRRHVNAGSNCNRVSVADFYRELTNTLRDIGIPVKINLVPNEIADPIPFDQDETHCCLRSRIRQSFLARFGPEPIAFLKNFVRAFAANAARSIFSGAASIWL